MSASSNLKIPFGRSEDRLNVAFSLPALVNGKSCTIDIENVSENGILIADYRSFRVGAIIEFSIPEDGWCTAEVVRSNRGETGCRFFEPISQAAIASMLLRSKFAGGSIRTKTDRMSANESQQSPHRSLTGIDMRGASVMLFVLSIMLGFVSIG